MFQYTPLLTNTMPVYTSSATMCSALPMAATTTTFPLAYYVAQPTALAATTCLAYEPRHFVASGVAHQCTTAAATMASALTTETKLVAAEMPIYGLAPIGSIRLQPLALSVAVERNFEVKKQVIIK